MYKLVIQDDEGKTTIVPLVRDEITVGRKEGNTIRLTERNVSRRHARIVRANGAIAIEDLESYNGVRVNGSRIDGRQPLTLKDRVQIGDYLIEVKDEGEDAPAAEREHHTEPMEDGEAEAGSGSSSSIPVAQDLADPDAKTRPMQAQMHSPDVEAPDAAPTAGAAASAAAAPDAATSANAMPAAAPQPARAARLIALSANFAGVEFPLTEPAMVIGRTEENDIVVSHRSISRNHAKVVRENSHYAIVDLQSSNGVRVNGEEYGKVELRRGDIIDLGHVRLRFADPDDDYVFSPEDIEDVTTGGSKSIWYALLAVLVLVGGIGLFTVVGSGGDESKSVQPTPTPPDPAPTTVVAATADAGEEPDSDTEEPAVLLERAKKAVEDRKWAHAQVAADKLLEKQPGDAEAKKLQETAKREAVNETRYQEMMKAIESKAYQDVPDKLAEIEKSSVYFEQATAAHDEALDAYIRNELMPAAEPLLATRRCSQLQNLENKTRQQWAPAAEQVSRMVAKCREARRPPPPPPPPPPQNDKSFDELMTEAKDAAKAGQYGKAQRLCSDALKLKPGDQDAVSVCGIAACGQNNAKAAKRYHKMAIGERKQQIVQICLLKGIDILR